MYRRVLVPLDGSKLAEGILPFTTQIAGPLDLEVILLRVLEPIPPDVVEGSKRVVVEDIEARMAEARASLRPVADGLVARGVKARVAVRRGSPVAEIVAETKESGADLIAMTTHGRSGLGRLLFGSVAEAVLRQAEVPVLMMRLTERQAAASPAA
jgi:nucleotide-binding universal stress UspA family protein